MIQQMFLHYDNQYVYRVVAKSYQPWYEGVIALFFKATWLQVPGPLIKIDDDIRKRNYVKSTNPKVSNEIKALI